MTILLNGKPASGEEIQMIATQETIVLDEQGVARPESVREGNRHFLYRTGPDRNYTLEVPEDGDRIYRITATGIQTEDIRFNFGPFKSTNVRTQTETRPNK